ncbi:hypothetical protein Q3G72_005791 [Acer saccharum]|nr:hypothetical protein Q3G72_005791 [Acer saccharum]
MRSKGSRNYAGFRNGAGGSARNGANSGNGYGGFAKDGAGGHSKFSNDSFRSGHVRKVASEAIDSKHGNNVDNRPTKNNLKNGRSAKKIDGGVSATGNRFEILNEEMEETLNEENVLTNAATMNNKIKGKVVLSEITNAVGRQNFQPGKGNRKGIKKVEKLGVKKLSLQESASSSKRGLGSKTNSQDQQFSLVGNGGEVHDGAASTLEEAMAEIAE